VRAMRVWRERAGNDDSAAGPARMGSDSVLPRLLTLSEVAEILRVSPKTVRRMAALRRIPCVRFGRGLRFFPGDVLAWLSARKEG